MRRLPKLTAEQERIGNARYRAYSARFRASKTSSLIRGYRRYNDDFRRIARDELRKRGVKASELPFKRRKQTSSRNPYTMRWF